MLPTLIFKAHVVGKGERGGGSFKREDIFGAEEKSRDVGGGRSDDQLKCSRIKLCPSTPQPFSDYISKYSQEKLERQGTLRTIDEHA